MPELPEVEVSRRGIEPWLTGVVVTKVVVRDGRLRWPVPSELQELVGLTIRKVRRRAKYLLLESDFGTAILHLGMSGSVRILPQGSAVQKHDHVDIELANGKLLRLNDPRRFGALLWTRDDPLRHPLLAKLGPEPLTEAFNVDYLQQQTKGRSTVIKSFLMDNHVVVGVGNIYANEALYAAGIHPKRAAGNISTKRLARLVDEVKKVLAAAIMQGGSSLKDFTNADGKPGYFVQQLQVYGRGGLPCYQCQSLLSEVRIGQRTTVFCHHCQR